MTEILKVSTLRQVSSPHAIDFLWYAMAAFVATIAVLADALALSGTLSEPMLWVLFGVAISRILTKRERDLFQKHLPISLPPSSKSSER